MLLQPTRLPLQKEWTFYQRDDQVAAATVLSVFFRASSYGRGNGVGRGLALEWGLGVGVGLGVAVDVAVAVGVEVGVAVAVGVGVGGVPPDGTGISTVMGDPVLKKPTVALAFCGG